MCAGLIGVVVFEHRNGLQHDFNIAAQRPGRDIFKIGLEPVSEVFFLFGGTAMAAHLRKASEARLEAMALPILVSDQPCKTGVFCARRTYLIAILTCMISVYW